MPIKLKDVFNVITYGILRLIYFLATINPKIRTPNCKTLLIN